MCIKGLEKKPKTYSYISHTNVIVSIVCIYKYVYMYIYIYYIISAT